MTAGEALRDAARRLGAAGCTTPELDADVLLGHVAGWDRAARIARRRDVLDENLHGQFEALVERRLAREPIAHLVGTKEFFSLALVVDARVLVPRPETERLVEVALELVPNLPERERGPCIVDVGTGSGAVALAIEAGLARQRCRARIVALDLSRDARAVARCNLHRHDSRIALLGADLLASLRPASVDLIVANPPYLSDEDLLAAPPELAFEPMLALAGGKPDGMGVIDRLLASAREALVPAGWLCFEIGAGQGEAALGRVCGGGFGKARLVQDFEGRDRIVVCCRGD